MLSILTLCKKIANKKQSFDDIEETSEESNPTQRYVNVHSNTKGSWITALAFLDTGADDNWISEHLVRQLHLEINTKLFEEVRTANNEAMRSIGTVEVDWSFKESGQTRRSTFQVAVRPAFELLVGRKLLFDEGIFKFEKRNLVMVKNTAKPSKGMLRTASFCILHY